MINIPQHEHTLMLTVRDASVRYDLCNQPSANRAGASAVNVATAMSASRVLSCCAETFDFCFAVIVLCFTEILSSCYI